MGLRSMRKGTIPLLRGNLPQFDWPKSKDDFIMKGSYKEGGEHLGVKFKVYFYILICEMPGCHTVCRTNTNITLSLSF